MNDVEESLKRAMVRQRWIFGEKYFRLGHPFEWVDGDQLYRTEQSAALAMLQRLTSMNEEYPTPDEILTCDYKEMIDKCQRKLREACQFFAPFLSPFAEFEQNIVSTALVRTQDYCFVKTFCNELTKPTTHLDIGPGLGSQAIYSMMGLGASYYALEANPSVYSLQRHFFRFLAPEPGTYLDLVECENFELDTKTMSEELNHNTNYQIKHVPSWWFPLVSNHSLDLITAHWVLNEITFSGILWLIAHSTRSLRPGGYFYIRDSSILKPGRHSIDYDKLLVENGFAEVGRLDVRNRIDLFGVPRIYQKQTDKHSTYEELVDAYLGKFAVVVHGGELVQDFDPGLAGKQI